MDISEINEKRYEIATGQVSLVMLVGLFSNIGIFAITAFADLSSGAQTDWKVIVGDYYYASTESNASNGMLTTMSGSSTGNGAFTKAGGGTSYVLAIRAF